MFSALTPAQIVVASGTISSAATIVAASAAEDGIDPTTGWAGGVIMAGVSVFLYLDRRAQRKEQEADIQRRAQDIEASEKMRRLEAQLEQERDAHLASITQLHEKHREDIALLNQRMIDLLTNPPN